MITTKLDLSQVRRHFEFKADENEAVRVSLYNGTNCIGPRSSKSHYSTSKTVFQSLTTEIFVFKKNKRYFAKQQYNPLYALYFSPSQPSFHSCQQLNVALP